SERGPCDLSCRSNDASLILARENNTPFAAGKLGGFGVKAPGFEQGDQRLRLKRRIQDHPAARRQLVQSRHDRTERLASCPQVLPHVDDHLVALSPDLSHWGGLLYIVIWILRGGDFPLRCGFFATRI